MNKLKKKVLKYLSNNKGKKIFIDTKIEISSDQIVTLANNINQKKIDFLKSALNNHDLGLAFLTPGSKSLTQFHGS